MEKGTQPQSRVLAEEYISWTKDLERLKITFQLSKSHAYYHVICREHRTGKTTLLRIAASKIGKDVIYINFPENFNELGDEFGNALNLIFEKDSSLTVRLLQKFLGGIINLKLPILSERELYVLL